MPDERIRREVMSRALRAWFRGIIFKRLIIRHSEIMLLHDNYIGAAVRTAGRERASERAAVRCAECRFTPDSP
jgi:hypothetical protein